MALASNSSGLERSATERIRITGAQARWFVFVWYVVFTSEISDWNITPPKTNMEPENDDF